MQSTIISEIRNKTFFNILVEKWCGDIETIRTEYLNCLFVQYKDAKDAMQFIGIVQTKFEIELANKFHNLTNDVRIRVYSRCT